jgi:O-antigen ligase
MPSITSYLINSNLSILLVLLLAIYVLYVILLDFRWGLLLVISLLPFEDMLSLGSLGSGLKLLVFLSTIGCFFQYFLRNNNSLRLFNDSIFYLILVFTCWSLASISWSVNASVALGRTITYIGNIALFTIIVASGKKWLPILWTALTASCVIAVLLGPFLPRPEGLENIPLRFTTGGLDPNDLAGLLVITITVALYAIYPALKRKVWQLALIVGIIVMTIAIFLTQSRTGLAAFVTLLIFSFYKFIKRHKYYFPIILFATVIFAFGTSVFFGHDISSYLTSLERESSRKSTMLDARLAVWTGGLGIIKAHPFLGVGSGNSPLVINKYSDVLIRSSTYDPDRTQSAHNIILSIWGDLGLVGVLIFVTILIVVFRRSLILFTVSRWGNAMFISFVLVIIVGMALSWEYKKLLFFLLGTVSLLWQTFKDYKIINISQDNSNNKHLV